MSSAPDLTSDVVKHARAIVAGGIALLVGLCWWFLAAGAGIGTGMGMPGMSPPPFAALLLMWWLMMVAMMLPSAAPAILLYARVRTIRSGDSAVVATWLFLAGYLLAWFLFSIVAASTQHLLMGASMALGHAGIASAVLIVAGAYQMSRLKGACLGQCRSPAQFLSRYWRPGVVGAVRLGLLHGTYCVGCCWMLMVLLFVGGIMNLWWIAALTLLVGIEKLAPRGDLIGRAAGVVLIAWGAARLIA